MALIVAAKNNDVYALREAIASGVDLDSIDEYGYTALMHASRLDFMEIVIELLENGASIESTSDCFEATPLMHASTKGNLAIVRELIARGADVDATDDWGYTALMYATVNRKCEIVIELLKSGADQEIYNEDHHTPLEIAYHEYFTDGINALKNHVAKEELVKLLYSNGVSEEVSKWCGSFLFA